MSSAEVSRATGLTLNLTPPEDKNNFQDFLWGSFTYSDPEIESLTSRRYAGDVSLFETSGNLLFEFLEERLIGIDGAFHPSPSERTKFVENLSKALATRFRAPPKRDRPPSASNYVNYQWDRDGISASIWLPDDQTSSVNFSIRYRAVLERLNAKRKRRDTHAFGQ
jgi:hypothetical protein